MLRKIYSQGVGRTFCAGLVIGWLATLAAPGYGANIVVNHTNWDWYLAQPQAVIDAVAGQKIFFAHASVGANVLSGLSDLQGANPTQYPLAQTSDDGTPPAATVNGMIYEYNRGNPDWTVKVGDFTAYIHNGWFAPKVDFVMNKFCFIDQTADWVVYRNAMTALETAYPGTRFVYWTMPLKTDSDSDQVLRAQFNENLRNWIATQDHKILFDIADIEAWTPAGAHQTFIYNGTAYEQLAAAYSADGGHLNQTGYDRVATGLYSLWGQATLPPAAGTPTPNPTPGTPTPNPTGTPGKSPAGEAQAFPNPGQDEVNFDVPAAGPGTIEIRIYNFHGELLGRQSVPAAGGQRTVVKWDCAGLAPGVYLAQIDVAGKKLKNLKFAVKR